MARQRSTGARKARGGGSGPPSITGRKPARSRAANVQRLSSPRAGENSGRQRRTVERMSEVVFAQRGFRGTTMRLVAARAHCSVGQIYKLYPSKMALYRAVLESKTCLLEAQLDEALATSGTPEERLRRMLPIVFGFFQKNMAFFRIIALETGPTLWQGNRKFMERVERWRIGVHARVANLIREGQERGEFRLDASAELTATSLLSLIKGHTGEWIWHREGGRLVDRVDSILDLFFLGLRDGRTR